MMKRSAGIYQGYVLLCKFVVRSTSAGGIPVYTAMRPKNVFGIHGKCFLLSRGSDKHIKPNAKALVTIGPGKWGAQMVQAAMRMRQLEHTQMLVFVVNDEVCRCEHVRCDFSCANYFHCSLPMMGLLYPMTYTCDL